MKNVQDKISDIITAFAGSMWFVYLHIVGFAAWMLVVEKTPWPTLTLVVSLEAIFLSTFVMISQNRSAAVSDARAEKDYQTDLKAASEIADIQRDLDEIKGLIVGTHDKLNERISFINRPRLELPKAKERREK
jgi:uncharacterized membrane protein